MLDVVLQFLKREVNSFFLTRSGSRVEVKISKVVDEAGKYAFEEGSLCAAIINVDEERTFKLSRRSTAILTPNMCWSNRN